MAASWIENIPIEMVDKEETNLAFQLQSRMEFWNTWASRVCNGDPTLNCGEEACHASCDALLDHPSCVHCFQTPRGITGNCMLQEELIAHFLETDCETPVEEIQPFLQEYKVLKARLLGNESMSRSGAGVDGHMFIETTSILAKPKLVKDTVKKLQDHLEYLRKENARATAAAVRMRQTWVTLSRLIGDTLVVLQDPAISPSVAQTRALATLTRSRTHDLLFRAAQLPPVPLLGIDDQ
ncbi:hypothetical protein CC1G_10224 [Coprinopsis cinerea okayama7|uniref:Uncharacterized protein n=1 Tax=Coprinopsis cinerea (strain Okayama-7 / 130 / ATCC MYA-4618 / FGSC 9003) TaxID=240176 RepID=A8NPA8_COPC7|nr:hypothetical protein CC1G_10224 [Coprinopsis cinerea okayama7\|eukprot:XP_001835297.1 hypothetical protein CC1G_10224 [Coprinopsis cinerea okayama7\